MSVMLIKLQNSIQTLMILWSVYPIHTNSLFWVIFEELSFCHFLLQVLLLLVKAHSNLVDLSFEYLCFSSKWKTTILFPVLSHFFNGLCRGISLKRDNCFLHLKRLSHWLQLQASSSLIPRM